MSYMHVLGEGDYYNRQSSRYPVAKVTAHSTEMTAGCGRHQIAVHDGMPASLLLGERAQCKFWGYKGWLTQLVRGIENWAVEFSLFQGKYQEEENFKWLLKLHFLWTIYCWSEEQKKTHETHNAWSLPDVYTSFQSNRWPLMELFHVLSLKSSVIKLKNQKKRKERRVGEKSPW